MKMIKNKSTMLLAGLAALMLSVAAQAGTITFTGQGWSNGYKTGWLDDPREINVAAGEFRFTVQGGTTLDAFCIDAMNNLKVPGTGAVYNSGPATSSANLTNVQLEYIGRLYDHHYESITGSSTNSAAFQLALWEIIYDSNGTFDLSAGGFSVKSGSTFGGAVAQASTWLTNLGSALGLYEFTVLEASDPSPNQRLLTAARVPEPGTLALLGLGLLGAGAIRRRRS